MKKTHSQPAGKPRTDALRNRKRILEVAMRRSGDASRDGIAEQAGGGAGTLYRHE